MSKDKTPQLDKLTIGFANHFADWMIDRTAQIQNQNNDAK